MLPFAVPKACCYGRETRTARGRTDPEHIRATADAAAAVKALLDIEVLASGTGVMPISTRAKFFATLVAPPHPVMARAPLDRENQIGLLAERYRR